MSEPQTEAGRALLHDLYNGYLSEGYPTTLRDRILAVEVEATEAAMLAAFDGVQRIDRAEVTAPVPLDAETRNEAAEAVWKRIRDEAVWGYDVEFSLEAGSDSSEVGFRLVQEALAAERHATVKRLRDAFTDRIAGGVFGEDTDALEIVVNSILDEEAG